MFVIAYMKGRYSLHCYSLRSERSFIPSAFPSILERCSSSSVSVDFFERVEHAQDRLRTNQKKLCGLIFPCRPKKLHWYYRYVLFTSIAEPAVKRKQRAQQYTCVSGNETFEPKFVNITFH